MAFPWLRREREVTPRWTPDFYLDYGDELGDDGDTMLYRFYDDDCNLLYVGVTKQPFARFADHRRHSRWWHRVGILVTEWWPTRQRALAAELRAIHHEWPSYNITGVRRCG